MKYKGFITQFIIAILFSSIIGYGYFLLIQSDEYALEKVAGITLAVFLGAAITSDASFKTFSKYSFIFFNLLFGLGVGLNLFIAFQPEVKYAFIGLNSLINIFIFTFLSQKKKYISGSRLLSDLGQLIHLYTFFLIARGVWGVFSFTRELVWVFLLILLVLLIPQAIIFFSQRDALNKRSVFYIFLIALIMCEMSYVVNLWPLNYTSIAMMLTICAYIFFGLLYRMEKQEITPRLIRRHIAFAIVLFLIVAGASQWTIVS